MESDSVTTDEVVSVEELLARQVANAIYPILWPVEQQDCAIQMAHEKLVMDIARAVVRSFCEGS
jgi:hypothetical protein